VVLLLSALVGRFLQDCIERTSQQGVLNVSGHNAVVVD